jgi:hypothetical protein
MRWTRCVLVILCCLGSSAAWALPLEHYEITFEIFEENGNPHLLPAEFGDLSLGASLHLDLCWNPNATPQPGTSRYYDAVCGYEVRLGEYTAYRDFQSILPTTVHSGGGGAYIQLDDEAPRMQGSDTSSWHLDRLQFWFICAGFASSALSALDACPTTDLTGQLNVGPLTRPNGYGFPCTTNCGVGVGGSVFSRITSIHRVPVPEPSALVLLSLGLLGCIIGRRRRSNNRGL